MSWIGAAWTTGDEKRFLAGIVRSRLRTEAETILMGYLQAAAMRREWDQVSKRVVVDYALTLLQGLRAAA